MFAPISIASDPQTSTDVAAAIVSEVQLLDDTIDYLIGWRAHRRAQLKGVLAKLGQKSTTTLVRGVTIKLVPYSIIVCDCHGDDPAACPSAAAGSAIAMHVVPNGEGLSLEFAENYIRRRPLPLDVAPKEIARAAAPQSPTRTEAPAATAA